MRHYLFTTYYQPKSEERKAEYDFCIEKNKVASFDKIYLFVEFSILYLIKIYRNIILSFIVYFLLFVYVNVYLFFSFSFSEA